MKLKKFFAGVLAAAMMLTVGATAAFATTPVTDATGSTATDSFAEAITLDSTLTLTKHYTIMLSRARLRWKTLSLMSLILAPRALRLA